MSPEREIVIENIMVQLIGSQDRVQEMVDADSDARTEMWNQYPKFVVDGGVIKIQSGGKSLDYTYQELPSGLKLVLTQLSYKVFAYIVQNEGLLMATGPAGTGKTETVRDVCWYAGIELVVLSASDQMKAGDISGLTATATKTFCIDESNRLVDEATDALYALAAAKKGEAGVRLFATANSFANMEAYKAKMADVSFQYDMIVPDFAIIAYTQLAMQGFKDYRAIGTNSAKFMNDCRGRYKVDYYDFGMRKMKQVWSLAGRFRAFL